MDVFDLGRGRHDRRVAQQVSSVENAVDDRTRRTGDQIADLEERVDRLITTCEAMWKLVCKTTGLTDEHLDYEFWELDMSDGREDGTKKVRAVKCECGAMVNARIESCQFCERPAPKRSAWDRI